MVFGAFLWILIIASIPLLTSPEFVVREIRACCHHRIIVKCADKNFKIAIVQARYFASGPDEASVAAVIHSRIKYSSPLDDPRDFQQQDHQHHRFIPSSQPSVSLWDLDLKFAHELQKESVQLPFPVNTLPEWHPDHSSHASNRRRFFHYPRRPTIPPKFPSGSNFTAEKVLEMPLYETNFLDSSTIWNQPLFPIVQSESSESRSLLSSKYFSDTFQTDSPAKFRNKCLSYQTLMSSAVHRSSILPPQTQPSDRTTAGKPGWRFKDLRTYFNRRCSGKSECEVLLIQSNGQDEDFSRVCHLMPDGIIAVKYICFNSSIATSHSKCNVDVTPATEGFLMNPGYPHLYPGDLPCEFRLHVPQQKILLIFFDISIRTDQIKDKGKCRDELSVTDSHQLKLLSTCGDQGTAIAILSETHQLNITLNPQSRLAFPKRGFLAYYRVIGCKDPEVPQNSYLTFRNATTAVVICDVGHVFPDSLSRTRWLYCSPLDHRWLGSFPFCNDIRNLAKRNVSIEQMLKNDPSVWPLRHPMSDQIYFSDVGLPVIVIMLIFGLHGVILYLIWRQRNRLEEIENQTNLEMERMCSTNAAEEGSIFSFPDSFVEDLWDDDDELEETDQDRTLTTLTLHETDTTPNSSAARKITDFSHSEERNNGHIRYYLFHNDTTTSSTATSHNNTSVRNGHKPHAGYIGGQLVTFNGYFRQTAV